MSWEFFTEDELKCSHCGACDMDDNFMLMVDALRRNYGKPLTVTSAYRCSDHPVEVKKKKAGAHQYGRAVDLAVEGSEAFKIIKMAQEMGFTGIGVAQKGSGRFIHLDDLTEADDFPRPWVWSY